MKAKKAVKKNGMARNTYNTKVRKYASAFNKAFHDLTQFVETNCKGNPKKRVVALDSLTEIVDRYINLNSEVQEWCHNRGVNHDDFVCDIENKSFETI